MAKNVEKDRFYFHQDFLGSPDGRTVRILSEYYGPLRRIKRNQIFDTIVFFGSARIKSKKEAERSLANVSKNISMSKRKRLEKDIEMSHYYESARKLSYKLTSWSKGLKGKKARYIITSGGGGGIMEAANRGAKEADGISMGLTISLPHEVSGNAWISKDLDLKFHYFFMRKFWFIYLAKALIVMPGGFGTLDELMELLTLIQTQKISKRVPIVLFGNEFWNKVINWDYLVEVGTISAEDLKLFHFSDTVDDAFQYVTSIIEKNQLKGPNF